jgi:tRNA threonylcarbamoyladenosine modification (KEOPS) complex  Pcc1 subunit
LLVYVGCLDVSGKKFLNKCAETTNSKQKSKGEQKLNMPYMMTLRMVCSDLQITRKIYDILLPEIKTFSSQRAKIVFKIEDNQKQILCIIEAADITALRSTINSVLRLIVLIENLHKTIQT